jgi:hypothetical protein
MRLCGFAAAAGCCGTTGASAGSAPAAVSAGSAPAAASAANLFSVVCCLRAWAGGGAAWHWVASGRGIVAAGTAGSWAEGSSSHEEQGSSRHWGLVKGGGRAGCAWQQATGQAAAECGLTSITYACRCMTHTPLLTTACMRPPCHVASMPPASTWTLMTRGARDDFILCRSDTAFIPCT